jgi:hypothetical protein
LPALGRELLRQLADPGLAFLTLLQLQTGSAALQLVVTVSAYFFYRFGVPPQTLSGWEFFGIVLLLPLLFHLFMVWCGTIAQ